MRKNKLINDFTTGSVPKHLLSFMLPFVASNGLQVLYSLVDMIVVGQYVGSAGLSGVSQGGMLTVFTTIFLAGDMMMRILFLLGLDNGDGVVQCRKGTGSFLHWTAAQASATVHPMQE